MAAVDVLIAGGGIVGSGVAWALARRGVSGINVVDLDLSGIYASSELNAGGARATWWQPVNITTCAATLRFFREHRDEFGFRQNGYLWLYDDADLFARAREKMQLQNSVGLGVEALGPDEVARRFPIIDRSLDTLNGATFSPRDGLVNPNAVRTWYRREAEALGVKFLNRHYITGVTTRRSAAATTGAASSRVVEGVDVVEVRSDDPFDRKGLLRRALTTHRIPIEDVVDENRLECSVLINCLGAWSALFSAKVGVPDFTEPVRRQITMVDVRTDDRAPGVDLESMGMIVDANKVYFHPEGPHFLAGFSIEDEPPGYDFSYDASTFFQEHVWPRLYHRCSTFERCRDVGGWAGLYAVTPDRSGIVGAV
jgi:sarcosine oxidase subunit beta